jgi:hypothetical protein
MKLLPKHSRMSDFVLMDGWGLGLVVRAVGLHAGDPGSIPGRDGLYIFGCIPQCFESPFGGDFALY